jgi:small subunit ribosomal protein S17
MKKLQGTVVSLKNQATASVSVHSRFRHPLYKKYVSLDKKYACQVDDLALKLGDQVEIVSCRPFSKTKSFRVTKVI